MGFFMHFRKCLNRIMYNNLLHTPGHHKLLTYPADFRFGRIDKPSFKMVTKIFFVFFKCDESIAWRRAFNTVIEFEVFCD